MGSLPRMRNSHAPPPKSSTEFGCPPPNTFQMNTPQTGLADLPHFGQLGTVH